MAIFVFFLIIAIVFIFSSKKLSPIPYFPSQKIDLQKIVKALDLRNNQTVFDLGAGDGVVIFEAAQSSFNKRLNTKFIAVEINPILILILYLRRLSHPNRQNIRIIRDDIFKMNFSKIIMKQYSNITIYLYISPWHIEKTILNIKDQISKFRVVSYMYSLPNQSNASVNLACRQAGTSTIQGKNSIFIYDF